MVVRLRKPTESESDTPRKKAVDEQAEPLSPRKLKLAPPVLPFPPSLEEPVRKRPQPSLWRALGLRRSSPPQSTSLFWPVSVTLLATGANIYGYDVEWSLYAVYFKQVYGLSGVWSGAAQMSGDILAAFALLLSQSLKPSAAWEQPGWFAAATCIPARISLLLAAHALLLTSLASEHLLVSLSGQILMGCTFVFTEQYVRLKPLFQPRFHPAPLRPALFARLPPPTPHLCRLDLPVAAQKAEGLDPSRHRSRRSSCSTQVARHSSTAN